MNIEIDDKLPNRKFWNQLADLVLPSVRRLDWKVIFCAPPDDADPTDLTLGVGSDVENRLIVIAPPIDVNGDSTCAFRGVEDAAKTIVDIIRQTAQIRTDGTSPVVMVQRAVEELADHMVPLDKINRIERTDDPSLLRAVANSDDIIGPTQNGTAWATLPETLQVLIHQRSNPSEWQTILDRVGQD